jgi:hypothetical protein
VGHFRRYTLTHGWDLVAAGLRGGGAGPRLCLMFDGRAFRTWGRVLLGACVVSSLFLGLMLMTEEVVGTGARLSRAVVTVTAAAFLGYLGTAWIIRSGEGASDSSPGGRR